MTEKIKTLISEGEIIRKFDEIAKKINKDYIGKELILVCILKGSIYITCELSKRINVPVILDFMSVSSYGNDIVSSNKIVIKKDLDEDIQNKHVLIVEDIIDSGRTLTYLARMLKKRNPASLKICTLLDKPDRREKGCDITVDYTGFVIPDEFVVGYGLDYSQRYRNLQYIGVMDDYN